jgi:hypothetical protein
MIIEKDIEMSRMSPDIKEKRGRILWTLLIQLINYKPLHKTNHKRRILPLRNTFIQQ